jgi:hypothetical protein
VFAAAAAEGSRAREAQCDALEPLFLRSLVAGVPGGHR